MDPVYPNAPFALPIVCDENADFSLQLAFYNPDADGNPDLASPIDMSAYTWRCQIRDSSAARARLLATLAVGAGSSSHEIILSAPAASLPAPGEWVYDLLGIEAGQQRYFLASTFTVRARSTK